jgi:diguanylate cyclase (GGDEF)-like protein
MFEDTGFSMERSDSQMTNDSPQLDTFSVVTRQLAALEKRDWELWVIVCLVGVLVAAGLLSIIVPAAFTKQEEVHLQLTVSRQLVVGLFVLLALLNSYLLTRRLELRRARHRLISSTIQNELVRLQSFTDPLTEVYNRRSLDEMAGRFISHARRLGNSLTFMLVDVDRFKEVNTRFGHLTADFALAEVATLLRSSVRGSDAVVRYGGDEFLVILADAGIIGARRVVQRIRKYLLDWNSAGHLDRFDLSLSIGISEWSDGQTLDEILDSADKAMYVEKEFRKAESSNSTAVALPQESI